MPAVRRHAADALEISDDFLLLKAKLLRIVEHPTFAAIGSPGAPATRKNVAVAIKNNVIIAYTSLFPINLSIFLPPFTSNNHCCKQKLFLSPLLFLLRQCFRNHHVVLMNLLTDLIYTRTVFKQIQNHFMICRNKIIWH